MADIAGPTILSAVRINGYQIEITFSLGSSGMTKVYADVRTMTGSWAQGNAEDLPGPPRIVVSSRAGVSLDANVAYQVKLRGQHSSNMPVAESNTVNVGAWDVPTPTLLSATRINPTTILLTYEGAVTAGGAKLYVDARATPGGTWGRFTSFPPSGSSGTYTLTLSPEKSYEVRILAGQYGVYSDLSSARSVNAWSTDAPNVTAVSRTGESAAAVTYTGAVAGAVMVVQYRLATASGSWANRSFTPSSASGTYTLSGLLSGAAKYDVRAYNVVAGVDSVPSSERALEAWFSIPAGVSDLSGSRRADGTVDLAWSGSATTRTPYDGQRVYRAEGELGQFAVLPAGSLTGGRRTFHDATAKPERDYRYMVVPYNQAGEASSRPTVKSNATLTAPNAPSTCTAVYVSDTTADVSWADAAAPGKPVTKYRIQRLLVGGAWANVGEVPGTVLSLRHTGLTKNGVYRFRVLAVNTAAVSVPSAESADVVTTPAGASRVTATRNGFDVVVVWQAPANTIAASWTVEHTTDPDPVSASEDKWFPLSAGTLSGAARQMVHVAATGGLPHTYRVRPTLTGAPVAPWVLSVKLSQFLTPAPPTLLPVEPVDANGTIRLGWVYNSLDGTPQYSGEAQYRVQGTSTWTRNVTHYGGESFHDVPAGTLTNGTTYEWRVEVESLDAGPATSAIGVFTTRARPIVYIVEPPTGEHKSSTLDVRWSTPSQSAWTAHLLDSNGNIVATRNGRQTSQRTTTFTGLVDGETYTVRVVIRDSVQESLPAEVGFVVVLDKPNPPALVVTPNPGGATVDLYAEPDQGGTAIRTERVEIIRINPDGTTTNLGDVDAFGRLVDRLPPLGVGFAYKARAWSAAPSFADSVPIETILEGTGVVINWGPNWAESAVLLTNLTFSTSTTANVELIHFDRDVDGPNFPVPYMGASDSHTVTVAGDVVDELGSSESRWRLVTRQVVVWYRDPEGRSFVASVPTVSLGQTVSGALSVGFTASEVSNG